MYYITFLLGALLSVINDRKGLSAIIFALVLLLLAFFRFGVGADYFAYWHLFERLSNSIIYEISMGVDSQEIGFRLIGVFFNSIGLSYQQYLSMFAIINIYFVYRTAKEFSKNTTLSLLIYFAFHYFVWTFSGIRQGVTIAVGVYFLLKTIKDQKVLRLLIVTILLSVIHTSALILLPLYLISKLNLNRKKLVILAIFGIGVSVLPVGLILQPLLQLPIISRMSPYIDASYSLTNIFDFQMLVRILFLTIGLFYYNAYSSQDSFSKSIINIYLMSFILYFFLKFSELTAARLTIYGRYLDVIILANFYYLYKDKINKLLYIVVLTSLLLVYFFKEINDMERQSGFINNVNPIYMPYTNIFNEGDYNFNRRYFNQ